MARALRNHDREPGPRSAAGARLARERQLPRLDLISGPEVQAGQVVAPETSPDAAVLPDDAFLPGLTEKCVPQANLRFSGKAKHPPATKSSLLVSVLAHAAVIATAFLIISSTSELPRGGEEAIPVEIVVIGPEQSMATEAGAMAVEVTIPAPDETDIRHVVMAPPPVEAAETSPSPLETAVSPVAEPESTTPALLAPVLPAPPLPPVPSGELVAPAPVQPIRAAPAPLPRDVVRPQPKPPEKQVQRREAALRQVVAKSPPAPRQQVRAGQGQGESGIGQQTATRQASAAGGTSGAANSAGAAEIASYRARIMAHLARYKTYPDSAREAGTQGRTSVSFTVARAGSLTAVSLAGSSGAGILDQATLAMVRRAAPFPVMPDGGPASMSFTAGIRYDLR